MRHVWRGKDFIITFIGMDEGGKSLKRHRVNLNSRDVKCYQVHSKIERRRKERRK